MPGNILLEPIKEKISQVIDSLEEPPTRKGKVLKDNSSLGLEGKIVFFTPHSPEEFTLDDKVYLMVKEEDVLAYEVSN